MGVTFHSTYRVKRVEGRRDETPTIKTNWSPRSAAEAKEKPAGMNRRACGYPLPLPPQPP
jgi:hypothetical protein